MLSLRLFGLDLLVFFISRVFEASVLAILMFLVTIYIGSTFEAGTVKDGGGLDVFGSYLVVRAYFFTFGYLPLSMFVFIGLELMGGFRTRNRVLGLNAGVLLVHGVAIGLLSPSASTAYWLAGGGLVAFTAIATIFVWWPWLSRKRQSA